MPTGSVNGVLKNLNTKGRQYSWLRHQDFYTTEGMGRDEVRMAYVLCKDDLAKAMKVLQEALKAYPGHIGNS